MKRASRRKDAALAGTIDLGDLGQSIGLRRDASMRRLSVGETKG